MSTTPAAPTEPTEDTAAIQAADSAAPDAAAAVTADQTPAATAARLAELFPALFAGAPKPLKLRIQVDIQERAPGVFSKQALSAFFRRYTGGTAYLIAVSKGKARFDLDGQPAGELSDEHRQVATDELARRRTNANAKRELEDQQRRNRATLLRDFETTKLTTANFCALKGVPVEALDGLLALARADALEDAQRPRRPEQARREGRPHNGPHNGPRGEGRPPRRP
jgi:ProP effector